MAEQEKFQEQDRVYDEGDLIGRIVTFLNVYDRGYRAKRAAWLAGKQHALQPPSARSDERFRDRTTVYAATIAHDRSGNERAVNVCKRWGLFKRGFKPGMDPVRFDLLWRTWGFQVDFLYRPIL